MLEGPLIEMEKNARTYTWIPPKTRVRGRLAGVLRKGSENPRRTRPERPLDEKTAPCYTESKKNGEEGVKGKRPVGGREKDRKRGKEKGQEGTAKERR